jgi:uncharacterized membrane protein
VQDISTALSLALLLASFVMMLFAPRFRRKALVEFGIFALAMAVLQANIHVPVSSSMVDALEILLAVSIAAVGACSFPRFLNAVKAAAR